MLKYGVIPRTPMTCYAMGTYLWVAASTTIQVHVSLPSPLMVSVMTLVSPQRHVDLPRYLGSAVLCLLRLQEGGRRASPVMVYLQLSSGILYSSYIPVQQQYRVVLLQVFKN